MCILPNLSMSDVIFKQLLQLFSSSLSYVQMKDKMVLSCLKLKQNSFKYLKQSMFIHNKSVLNVLESLKKCIQEKQYSKRENCFDRE